VQALSAFVRVRPDIVLLNVLMPEMDGFTTCATLRTLPGGAHTPVLMVTGLDDTESINRAYEVGATDFITKPFNWVIVSQRVRYILRASRAMEALRKSEAKNHALLQAIPDMIWQISKDGTFLDYKPAKDFEPLLPPAACLGKKVHEVHSLAIAQRSMVSIAQALQTGETQVFEYQLPQGGAVRDYETRIVACGEDEVLAIVRDITTRKQAEEALHKTHTELENRVQERTAELVQANDALRREATERHRAEEAMRESETRYRSLFENAVEGIFRSTPEGRFAEVNPALVRMLGYDSADEVLALWLPDDLYVDPTERERLRAQYEPLGVLEGIELRWKKKDGTPIIVSLYAQAMHDAQGTLIGYEGMVLDITKRKQAEEELLRLSVAVRMSTDSIVLTDLEGKITEVNEAALRMYGTDEKGDLVGRSAFEFIVPEEQEQAFVEMAETLEKGYIKDRQYHAITKNGSRVPVEMSAALMTDRKGKLTGFVGISRDITERKRAEALLQQEVQIFRG
jgi:PAS domain S-box-containing protein